MESQYKPSDCTRCIHFVRFTNTESLLIQSKISRYFQKGKCLGACVRPLSNSQFLIHRYIFGNEGNCEPFERGFYQEKTGIACPQCIAGKIVIVRPLINNQTVIIIGCSRHPDCGFHARQIPISTVCRICNTPLMITGGEILKCYCPECNRSIQVPISIYTWPDLIKPQGGCVHSSKIDTCEFCNASREQKKSLVDIELPFLIQEEKREKEKKIGMEIQKAAEEKARLAKKPLFDYSFESLLYDPRYDTDLEFDTEEEYQNYSKNYWKQVEQSYKIQEKDDLDRKKQ